MLVLKISLNCLNHKSLHEIKTRKMAEIKSAEISAILKTMTLFLLGLTFL